VGVALEEQAHDLEATAQGGEHERGVAGLIARVRRDASIQDRPDDVDVAGRGGREQGFGIAGEQGSSEDGCRRHDHDRQGFARAQDSTPLCARGAAS
jgi:hypothetical protein